MKKKVKTLTLQIPEPCGENFNKMTPIPGGRHCASCEKTVVDFRNYSDTEIGRYYKRHQGKICGVFQANQLNRAMILPKDPSKLGKWKAVAAMLSGLAIGGTASAQQTMGKPMPSVKISQNVPTQDVNVKPQNKVLIGKITDENGETLIGASVLIKGTSVGTITELDGFFELEISHHFSEFDLVISYMGYESFEQHFNFKEVDNRVFEFKLKTGIDLPTVVVIAQGSSKNKCVLMGSMVAVRRETYVEEIKPEIQKKKVDLLKISPNPFFDYLNISFDALTEDAYIFTLYTQMGQLVFAETQELKTGKQSVEIRPNKFDLPAGTYILNVTNERDFSESTQVVKVK